MPSGSLKQDPETTNNNEITNGDEIILRGTVIVQNNVSAQYLQIDNNNYINEMNVLDFIQFLSEENGELIFKFLYLKP